MEQEIQNNQQDVNYEDPLAATAAVTDDGKPAKKQGGTGSVVGSTIAAVVVWKLFGLAGGLICYAGFWAVRALVKSKLPLAARIVLSVLVTLGFLVLMCLYVLYVVSLTV